MRSVSLKSKVVFGVAVLTVIILVAVSAVQMHYMRQDMTRMLADQQFAAVSRVAQDVDAKFETNRDVMVRLAKGFSADILRSRAATRDYFAARPALLASFDDVLVLNPDGAVVADFPEFPDRAGMMPDMQDDFHAVLATGLPRITEPKWDVEHGQPALEILVPVFDSSHDVAGVLVAVLTLQNKNLLGTLGDAKVGKSGVFVMLSKTMPPRFLVHPNKAMILKPRPANGATSTLRALKGFEGSAEDRTSAGELSLISYKSLTAAPWLLMAVVPLDEVYAPIKSAERRLWLITLAVCIVVLPLSWLFARIMLNPLSVLRDDIERMRHGRFDAAPRFAQRGDEVGDLARSFQSVMQERTAAAASQHDAEHQMRVIAESTARSKSELLATMSHEVRTPMNGVLGITELLLDTPLNSQQREYATTILNAGQSLLAIANDILDLSKSDAGKLELESIPFDPVRLSQEVIELFAGRASAKGLVITKDVAADVPRDLLGDPSRLRQVLTNLISNALKFTANGWIRIELSLDAVEDQSVILNFAVKDSGIGMTPEQQQRLFQAYSQADVSTSRRFGGTGLGLTICARLVELMGGSFRVSSAPGAGSVFAFTLKSTLAEPGSAQPQELPQVRLEPIFAGRVLLVEDNVVNRTVARATLNGLGCEVLEAENGSVALDTLAREQIDLILMDMNMPVMDGIEATRRIRAAESDGSLSGRRAIIAMTANVMREAVDACREAGMDDFLPKPFQRSQLIAKLGQLLATSGRKAAGLGDAAATQGPPLVEDAVVESVYQRTRQAMGEDMPTLLDAFNSSSVELIEELSVAIRDGDALAIGRLAHSLKSSAAALGAMGLSTMAAELEAAALVGNLAGCEQRGTSMLAEFKRVEAALQRLIQPKGVCA